MTQTKQLPFWTPRSYQFEGVKLGLTQACAGYLLRPGMGKTTIVYAIVKILKDKKMPHRTIVIAPIKPMYNVWPHQCHAWSNFDDLKVRVAHGKDRVDALKDSTCDIVVINPLFQQFLYHHIF